jgi:TetR/AcrR family transcriptional repressor of mexJK operon
VAKRARVAKRTFYARFPDKAALFRAVVERLIADWSIASAEAFVPHATLEETLGRVGRTILDVALTPAALGLRRLMFAESGRFPELVEAVQQAGAGVGAQRIAALLHPEGDASPGALFAARQFMAMILSEPLNRAAISGTLPGADDRQAWVTKTVRLFLEGWSRAGAAPRGG